MGARHLVLCDKGYLSSADMLININCVWLVLFSKQIGFDKLNLSSSYASGLENE